MPFGVRLPDRAEIEKRLGFPTPAFWPETMEVPSFTKSNKAHNRGVVFGHKLLSPRSILRAIGFPEAPARGATGKLPSFTEDNRKQGRGAFGSCLPSLLLYWVHVPNVVRGHHGQALAIIGGDCTEPWTGACGVSCLARRSSALTPGYGVVTCHRQAHLHQEANVKCLLLLGTT